MPFEQKTTAPYGGFTLCITLPGEAGEILEKIRENKRFTHGVSNRDLKPRGKELCILAFDEARLHSLWLAHFGSTAKNESARRRGAFTEFVDLKGLETKTAASPIRAIIEGALQKKESRLPPADWDAVLSWIRSSLPNDVPDIECLEGLRCFQAEPIYDPIEFLIAEQWDATGCAMEFAGFERKQILPILDNGLLSRHQPFVFNLPGAKTFEEDILPIEMRNVIGWDLFRECQGGFVRLRRKSGKSRPDHELTVVNTNKKALEECLGVDLIFHSAFDSCVLIQYKRLSKQGIHWFFDLNDDQFTKQLAAIRDFKKRKLPQVSAANAQDYRISREPFFFKFCKEQLSNDDSKTLFDGWYVPAEHLELIKASSESSGVHGGRRLTEGSAGRWFSNSDFAPLLSSGWVGTYAVTSALLKEMIQASLEGKRSLVFALAGRTA